MKTGYQAIKESVLYFVSISPVLAKWRFISVTSSFYEESQTVFLFLKLDYIEYTESSSLGQK